MARAMRLSWLSVRSAAPASASTKEMAPTRSAYSPRFCRGDDSELICGGEEVGEVGVQRARQGRQAAAVVLGDES